MENGYSKLTTMWKGISTFLKVLAGVLVGLGTVMTSTSLPPDWITFKSTWFAFTLPFVLSAWKMLENIRKNIREDGQPAWRWPWSAATPLLILLIPLLLFGCVTTKFHESITDPDGTIADTSYKAQSSAWPFGKLETANHTWHYGWGLDTAQNEISTGQNAAGMDNTNMNVLADLISKVVIEAVKAYMAMPLAPATPSVLPQVLEGLGGLLQVPR
jgi:hypothetical protein